MLLDGVGGGREMVQDWNERKLRGDAEVNCCHDFAVIHTMLAINVYYASLAKYSRLPEKHNFHFRYYQSKGI